MVFALYYPVPPAEFRFVAAAFGCFLISCFWLQRRGLRTVAIQFGLAMAVMGPLVMVWRIHLEPCLLLGLVAGYATSWARDDKQRSIM